MSHSVLWSAHCIWSAVSNWPYSCTKSYVNSLWLYVCIFMISTNEKLAVNGYVVLQGSWLSGKMMGRIFQCHHTQTQCCQIGVFSLKWAVLGCIEHVKWALQNLGCFFNTLKLQYSKNLFINFIPVLCEHIQSLSRALIWQHFYLFCWEETCSYEIRTKKKLRKVWISRQLCSLDVWGFNQSKTLEFWNNFSWLKNLCGQQFTFLL